MPITVPDSRLYVVVGVLRNPQGQLLVQQRLPGKPCAGLWEFPGGKVEKNESPRQALFRELNEEIGISVKNSIPLTQIAHDYEHANVWLDVYLIDNFTAQITNREAQNFGWKSIEEILQMDVLAAVHPILDAVKSL